MSIKQSRKVNKILEKDFVIEKEILEGRHFFKNEKRALELLRQHTPRLISATGNIIVTEKIKGQHLSEVIITEELMIALAQALNYIHSHKKNNLSFIHGDLHKDNILIDREGIKFIDFTCADYDDPLRDAAAVEIHITEDPILLKSFYKHLKIKRNKQKIDQYKLEHCLKHLEWAEKEGFLELARKSRRIVDEIIELREKKIRPEDFDYLGLIKLENVKGVEKLVKPLDEQVFLSREESYYSVKTVAEVSHEREEYKKLLPAQGKKAFVAVERMLNNSCRVYYTEFIYLLTGVSVNRKNFSQAKKCLDEDVKNICRLLEGKKARPPKGTLPESSGLTLGRQIESDHKMILFKTIKNLPKQDFVISPLWGGILIGSFFKAIHGTDYSHVLFGLHDQVGENLLEGGRISDILKIIPPSELARLPRSVTIFDDNVGTGETLELLKNSLSFDGRLVRVGSIEMSWQYYDQVVRGERKAKKFNFNQINFPTYRSTRHHSISNTLIEALGQGGDRYRQVLKKAGFGSKFLSDEELLYFRGRSIAEKYSLRIENDPVNLKSNLILSVDIMNQKIRYLEDFGVEEVIKIIYDYPVVNIIDIDRYEGRSANLDLIKKMLNLRKCRVGGGVRTKQDIKELLDLGAEKVIVGTFASPELLAGFPRNKIVVALDSTDRTTGKPKDIPALIKLFEPYCDEFQYVCVETDGLALGGDIKTAIKYSKLTNHKFNCVGGIAYKKEMEILGAAGVGCVVGRAIEEGYFG